MSRTSSIQSCLTAASAAVIAILVGTGAGTGWFRFVAALVFLTFAPGSAIVVLMCSTLSDLALRLAVSIACSLAVDALVSLALVSLHAWHPDEATIGLAVITLGLLFAAGLRVRSQQDIGAGPETT